MVEERDEKLTPMVTWPQWITGIEVCLLVTQVGLIGGWSSPYISQLTSPESEIPLTTTEVSLVVSLMNVGRLCGGLISAVCINYFGSKTTVLISSVPMVFCWLFLIVADSVDWLYAARISGGLSLGMIYTCFSLYLAEIANSKIRGGLVALGMTGLPLGNLLISIMGSYMSMRTSAIIALVPSLIVMFCFFWMPKSPHYLVKQRQDEKAKSSIRWYHRGCDVDTEFAALQKFVNLGERSLTDNLKELRGSNFRRTISLVMMLFIYSQLSGVNNIVLYMESILTLARVSVISPALVVTIVMSFGIVGTFLSSFLMDRFGRRPLLIASATGVATAMSLLTLEFHLLYHGFEPSTVEAIPIFAMIFFIISVFVGLLPVPSTILGEIFPPHLKCYATCFSNCNSGFFGFLSAITFLPLLHALTERYVFVLYALVMLSVIPFTLMFVPETKGLTLQEIQTRLTDKK